MIDNLFEMIDDKNKKYQELNNSIFYHLQPVLQGVAKYSNLEMSSIDWIDIQYEERDEVFHIVYEVDSTSVTGDTTFMNIMMVIIPSTIMKVNNLDATYDYLIAHGIDSDDLFDTELEFDLDTDVVGKVVH